MLSKIISWIKYLLGMADLNKDGLLNNADVQIARDKVETVKDAVELIVDEGRKVALSSGESVAKIEAAVKTIRTAKAPK